MWAWALALTGLAYSTPTHTSIHVCTLHWMQIHITCMYWPTHQEATQLFLIGAKDSKGFDSTHGLPVFTTTSLIASTQLLKVFQILLISCISTCTSATYAPYMYSVEHMFSTLYTLNSVDYTMGCTLFNCMSTWFCQKGVVLDLQRKHFILRKAQPYKMYTCMNGIGVPMYMYMHTYTYDMQYIQHSFSWMGIHQHIPMSKRVSECMNECHFREYIVGLSIYMHTCESSCWTL